MRMYNVFMIRKGEVLNLKMVGGTRRHWKRNTLHLASARKLDGLEWGLSRQESDQVTIKLDLLSHCSVGHMETSPALAFPICKLVLGIIFLPLWRK